LEKSLFRDDRGSGPDWIVISAKLAEVLGRFHRDTQVCAQQSVESIEPQDLTFENAAEVAADRVRDIL
jgi:hypothetical protein